MRLLLLCVISVFLSSKSFAQFNVYLKPVISQKFMSSIGGFPQKNITGVSPIPSPYLYHNHLNFMSVGGFDVGFDAGIQLKKHFFEFQYLYTTIGGGYRTSYFSQPFYPNYDVVSWSQAEISEKSAMTTHKLSLGYSYEAFRSKNNVFGLRLTSNVGLYFNPDLKKGQWAYNVDAVIEFGMFSPVVGDGVILIGSRFINSYQQRVNGFASLGLGFDFYTKSNRNLFSIDVNYTQGFRMLNFFSTTYTLDNNGTMESYNYVANGKGSTLNIQISRRFQLYPWIKSKRKELQEQGVYKSREK